MRVACGRETKPEIVAQDELQQKVRWKFGISMSYIVVGRYAAMNMKITSMS